MNIEDFSHSVAEVLAFGAREPWKARGACCFFFWYFTFFTVSATRDLSLEFWLVRPNA